MKFFLGTTNPYKVREFAALMSATGCELEITDPIDPEETESDFEGNAILKALAYAKHSGGITICEDSGLIVPALGNLPGPWSARFCEYQNIDITKGVVSGYNKSNSTREIIDNLNNEKVIQLMKGIEQPRRSASFKAVLVVADQDGNILFKSSGESFGWISKEMRGAGGFGYDNIFIGQDTFGKTYAELDSMRKNLRSHRKRVMQEFKMWLGQKLKNNG